MRDKMTTPRDDQCECGCSHVLGINDAGPCGHYAQGGNGRCARCDHSQECHQGAADWSERHGNPAVLQ